MSTRRVNPLRLIVSLLLFGCSGYQHAESVDAERARATLKVSLDAWKSGSSPTALKAGSPSIMVQDLDWITGAKLIDYQVSGDGRKREANLFVPVRLTLRTPKGREIKKDVSYIIGTSPSLTIYRAFH